MLFVAQVLASTAYAVTNRADGVDRQTFHAHKIAHHHGVFAIHIEGADEGDSPHEHRSHHTAQCTPIAETDWAMPSVVASCFAIRDVVFRSICSPPRYKPPRA